MGIKVYPVISMGSWIDRKLFSNVQLIQQG